jgi:hypothetical protein
MSATKITRLQKSADHAFLCHCGKLKLILLFQPVIERCENITFLCHAYVYDELLLNFKQAKLSIFNNKWNDVFNFNIYSNDPNAKN